MKRKFLRQTAALLLLTVTLTGCGRIVQPEVQAPFEDESSYTVTQEEGEYPIKWDRSKLYKTEEEWQADYDKVMEMLEGYDKFRGHLDNAKTIYEYFDFAYLSELTRLQSKLMTYAHLGESLNPTDPVAKNMQAKLDAMSRDEAARSAFADEEIFSMSLEERKKVFSDPIFDDFQYVIHNRRFLDPDYEPLTEDENILVSTLSMGMGYPSNIFSILNNVELPYPDIKLPNGSVEELNETLYAQIVTNPNYSDEFKKEANRVYLSRYADFSSTFASLLEENCAQAYASASIDGYDSTMEEAFADYDLDTGIYDMLVEAAHNGVGEYQRYLGLHAKALGLTEQYGYNMGTSASDFESTYINYDDAVNEVIEALSILGDDYTDHFKKIISSGQVDVYPTSTKESGAFETKLSDEYYPWVLFNYYGSPDDVSTIAHEMGHAVYDQYATENQPSQYSSPTVFTQEVASTTNELLYSAYKLSKAQDDEERLFYLENAIYMFSGTFFTQMMYSEFEDYMYGIVESGQALDAEDLAQKWSELLKQYRGDTVKYFPESCYQWASIPHFYYVYYVYQYAADVAYAASIAERITSGEAGAVDDYLNFLKLGGSAAPVELLKTAGVDPLSKDTYDHALDYFKSLVDEYERLTAAK
ncbi:MAG: hypothetical protein IJ695_10445 [Butyrivibrio sp.]|nr:hypothetical protein [Butyrivibrio sp.]